MKIILLRGDGNRGKTTTFNMLYDVLAQKYSQSPAKPQLGGDPKDFECVFKVNGGKKIVLYSMGDIKYCCDEATEKYKSADVLVMAYNTRFKNFCMNGNYSEMHIIAKTVAESNAEADKNSANSSDCDKIISLIKKLLS